MADDVIVATYGIFFCPLLIRLLKDRLCWLCDCWFLAEIVAQKAQKMKKVAVKHRSATSKIICKTIYKRHALRKNCAKNAQKMRKKVVTH